MRANGEGTIYESIQKNKKKFDNTKMCKICSECLDRSICNNRTGWEKCEKCANCTSKNCDRFYIYKRTVAQISTKEGRKTVASGKTKKEVNIIKEKTEEKLKLRENIKYGDYTLLETMNYNEKLKLQNKQINENSYVRNKNTIKTLSSHPIVNQIMIDITEEKIKECFSFFVDMRMSQSELEKIYDEMNGAFKLCALPTMSTIKRNDFLSLVEPKEVTAFTIAEEKKILKYISENENTLVSNRCELDAITVKNLIKILFAFGMRIGEACSLNKNLDIDFTNKKIRVHHSVTRDINQQLIIGKNTKTGRKKRRAGKKDERIVPFGVLFNENDVESILKEQQEYSSSLKENKFNLLFCTKNGYIISHTSFNSIFKRICRLAGVKLELPLGCNTHMTKHTAVTRMIELGIRIEVISVIVGTSVEVLQKTYAHILDDFIQQEIEKSIQYRDKSLSLTRISF